MAACRSAAQLSLSICQCSRLVSMQGELAGVLFSVSVRVHVSVLWSCPTGVGAQALCGWWQPHGDIQERDGPRVPGGLVAAPPLLLE
jgi:hypothetical protein